MKRQLPWRNGYIILDYTPDYLRVMGRNLYFDVKPRTVVVKGYKDYVERSNNKKYIYIYFREGLDCFTDKTSTSTAWNIEFYEVRYVKTHYDEYYTIILPGHFFIDYIIFNSVELLIVLSSKKKVFYESVEDVLTIYIV